MTKKQKRYIQWHPAFVSAMNLELREARDALLFEREYNLNSKPLQVDLLIIKKKEISTNKGILEFFRGHNILEYKSPGDHLDIDDFFKINAYAALYKAYGERDDCRKAEDITVTIVRWSKPLKVMRYLREHGFIIRQMEKGIFVVSKGLPFHIQFVVLKMIDKDKYPWLGVLSGKLDENDLRGLCKRLEGLTKREEKENADAVLLVCLKAYEKKWNSIKEEEHMYKALMELMEPEIRQMKEESRKDGMNEGIKEGVIALVSTLRMLGVDENRIKSIAMDQFHFSEAEYYACLENMRGK